MLGLQIQVTEKLRKEASRETYLKMLQIAWDAMERAGVLKDKGDLHLVLLGGKKEGVEKLDFSKVSL